MANRLVHKQYPQRAVERLRSHKYWNFVHHLASEHRAPQQRSGSQLAPVDESEKLRQVEAVIFLSPEGISSRKVAKLVGLADATEARTLIRKLNLNYELGGRSYRIEEVAGGFAILTRPNFAPWLRKLAHVPSETKLGQSAIETLAIVAYRQPVMRASVESIRGVGCSEVLKQLMEMDLVRISGRSEDLGRPYLYGTTRRFLQMFGLRSADRLPRMDWVNNFDSNTGSTHANLTQEPPSLDAELEESTVNIMLTAKALLKEECVDTEVLSHAAENAGLAVPASNVEDEDEFLDDDEDEFEDDDDDDWDDDDDDADDDLEEDSDWEEVDDDDEDDDDEDDEEEVEVEDEEEDEAADDEEDEDDDDWDDDDDDWDDDDEEEDDDDWD